jgi:hypothetical protein
MVTLSRDTSPEAERFQIEHLQQMPVARRVELTGQMIETMYTLAMSGLRSRYPEATPLQLKRYLADLMLGEQLAERVFRARFSDGKC